MKRFIIAALVLLLCVFPSLISVAYSHPGNTDSSGGHYNRSTGEYHYHHGYPEHQHYDTDGNGSIDCPYDFDDQTGRNSGSSSSSSKTPTKPTTSKAPEAKKKTTFGEVLLYIFVVPFVALYALCLLCPLFLWIYEAIKSAWKKMKEQIGRRKNDKS